MIGLFQGHTVVKLVCGMGADDSCRRAWSLPRSRGWHDHRAQSIQVSIRARLGDFVVNVDAIYDLGSSWNNISNGAPLALR